MRFWHVFVVSEYVFDTFPLASKCTSGMFSVFLGCIFATFPMSLAYMFGTFKIVSECVFGKPSMVSEHLFGTFSVVSKYFLGALPVVSEYVFGMLQVILQLEALEGNLVTGRGPAGCLARAAARQGVGPSD